jgi:hypothetical protein
MARRLLALTVVLFALSAPAASAATICVPFGTACDGGSFLSLQNAINAADGLAGRDTIRINAGYSLNENALVGPANVVDIVRGGQGQQGISVVGEAQVDISDALIRLSGGTSGGGPWPRPPPAAAPRSSPVT